MPTLPDNIYLDRPQDLGDGLTLRRATPDDTQALVEFHGRIFSREDRPNEVVEHWITDMLRGDHPTVRPADFSLVADEKKGGRIVSSLFLIPQTWSYDGIPFGVGRPEAVATDPEYRRKGLVARQFEWLHAESARRGHLLQAITGIPYYYRQFGYDMTVNLEGARRLAWHTITNLESGQSEIYRLRPAGPDDIDLLQQLYELDNRRNLLACLRDREIWRYELERRHPKTEAYRRFQVIETPGGEAIGYLALSNERWPKAFSVPELSIRPGHSWHEVGMFLTRALKEQAAAKNRARAVAAQAASGNDPDGQGKPLKPEESEPFPVMSFAFGGEHPLYEALDSLLDKPITPYAWYIRVPDLAGFLRHIAPALERRLQDSLMPNHSGTLRLNFYRSQLALKFERGKLVEVGTYQPKFYEDGDALFPDLTFYKLLFGHRSLDEVRYIYTDCYAANSTAETLLNCLFPKRASNILALE